MAPTLMPGDKVRVVTSFATLARGDIIVFHKPPNDFSPGITYIIKRIVGLPGESIQSGASGELLIDGQPIAQPWLSSQAKANPGAPIAPTIIPAGDYFVLGDNRGDSADSRVFGPVAGNLVVGIATQIVYPLNRIGGLTPPTG